MQRVFEQEELAGLRHLNSREKAALSEFVARLREKYADQVVLVVLFGSKVRGDFDVELWRSKQTGGSGSRAKCTEN